jgi:hypothetical protein
MMTIWKFPLTTTDEQVVQMPRNAVILSAQVQGQDICLWAMVNPESPKEGRHIRIVGTGHPFPEGRYCKFIGTVQLEGGSLVFHVFEKR